MQLSQANVARLMQQALSQTGLAIIPQLQEALQEELVSTEGPEQGATLAKEDFSEQAFKAMKEALLAELTASFSKASLAAISELAAARQNPLAHDVNTNPEFFENASESGDETTDAERHRSLTPADQGPATPEGPPAGSAPPLEGDMPTTELGKGTNPQDHANALRREHHGQPGAQPPAQPTPGAGTEAAPETAPAAGNTPVQSPEEALSEQQMQQQLTAEKQAGQQAAVSAQQTGQQQQQAVQGAQMQAVGQANTQQQDWKERALMKAAQSTAGKLTHNIANGVMNNWQLILGIAVLKDGIDYAELLYFDPGITGTIVDVIAKIVFAALLATQKDTFRKRLIKKYVTRIIIAICIEFIPVANEWIPAYTIDAVTIYIDCELTRRKEMGRLKQVQSMMKRFKKGKRRRMGPKTIRNYRQQINDISTQADN